MDTLECIKTRRSIRKFTEQPVEFDKLAKIMEAGSQAPSTGDIQNWRFILVTEKALIHDLYNHCFQQEVVFNAQAAIIVCGETDPAERLYGLRGKRLYTVQNCASATENMLLAAHALGLGACWIGAFDEDKVSTVFSIPGNARPQAIVAIGYPNENPTKQFKDLAKCVYFNSFGSKIEDLHLVIRDYSVEWKKNLDSGKQHGKRGLKKVHHHLKKLLAKANKSNMKSVMEKPKK